MLGDGDHTGGQGGFEIGAGVTSVLGLHQAVDGTEDGRERGGWSRDTVDMFQVETAWALVPQEGQVGWAELDRCGGHLGSSFRMVVESGFRMKVLFMKMGCHFSR